MESKYYTPSTEEFHVGFEYEEFVKRKGWMPVTLKDLESWNLNSEGFCIDYDDYRVKYLDREDIESLGWELGWKMGLNEDSFTYKDNQLYWQDNQWIQIYDWDSKIIFQGTIKNKSELKRLLKQLGI